MYESLQNVQDGHYTEAERSRGRTLSTSNISENVFLSQTCFTEYSHTQTVFQKRKKNHSTDTLYLFKMYSNQLKNVEPGSISLFSEMHERCAGTCVSIHGTAWVKTERNILMKWRLDPINLENAFQVCHTTSIQRGTKSYATSVFPGHRYSRWAGMECWVSGDRPPLKAVGEQSLWDKHTDTAQVQVNPYVSMKTDTAQVQVNPYVGMKTE